MNKKGKTLHQVVKNHDIVNKNIPFSFNPNFISNFIIQMNIYWNFGNKGPNDLSNELILVAIANIIWIFLSQTQEMTQHWTIGLYIYIYNTSSDHYYIIISKNQHLTKWSKDLSNEWILVAITNKIFRFLSQTQEMNPTLDHWFI